MLSRVTCGAQGTTRGGGGVVTNAVLGAGGTQRRTHRAQAESPAIGQVHAKVVHKLGVLMQGGRERECEEARGSWGFKQQCPPTAMVSSAPDKKNWLPTRDASKNLAQDQTPTTTCELLQSP